MPKRTGAHFAGLAAAAFVLALQVPSAAQPRVAASIAPVHSLVAGVMGEQGSPDLLIPGGQSPHTFAMRPSTARAIAHAGIVFRISPAYEIGLDAPLRAEPQVRVVNLALAPGVILLPARDADEAAHHPATEDGNALLQTDPHIWLDPSNARAMVAAIADVLGEVDPPAASAYEANAAKIKAWLDALDQAIAAELAPVRRRPFIVFHDGYQYFERHYGLAFAGAVTEMPGRLPGAAHIRRVRKEIGEAGAPCVFAEPQFEPRLVKTITEGLPVRTGVLDMLGADLEPGPQLYFDMMGGLSRAFAACLDG